MCYRFWVVALLSFLTFCKSEHESAYDLLQTVKPDIVQDSLFYFCMNIGQVPSENADANASISFHFDHSLSSPEEAANFTIFHAGNQLTFGMNTEQQFPTVQLLQDGKSLSELWSNALVSTGVFDAFIYSKSQLLYVTFQMQGAYFEDIFIDNPCPTVDIRILENNEAEEEEIQSLFSFAAVSSRSEYITEMLEDYYDVQVNDPPEAQATSKSVSLNPFFVYIIVTLSVGLIVTSIAIICIFYRIRYNPRGNSTHDWTIEMANLDIPEYLPPLPPPQEDNSFEYPQGTEKYPERFFPMPLNPFDEVHRSSRYTSIRSDSNSSFGSLEPEELSSPLRYLLGLRISDLIHLMFRRNEQPMDLAHS